MSPTSIVVTGGSGFIGSAFIRRVAGGYDVVNVDVGTYAADDRRLAGSDVVTERLDINDPGFRTLIASVAPAAIVHFAAETHVTRGEEDAELFFRSNVEGTRSVMEAARSAAVPIVIHVSTDEVYGPAMDRPFVESDKPPGEGKATSSYARSKALADDVARSFDEGMRVVIARPTNCFGPWQHPEKAIPRWVARALQGERLPVWGDGRYVRDWMFVEDACEAIELLLQSSEATGPYNIGPGGQPVTNFDIATAVARAAGAPSDAVYLTEYDRPMHDRRYSVDAARINRLGWIPSTGVLEGIRMTVDWYRRHREWWRPLLRSAETLYADEKERA